MGKGSSFWGWTFAKDLLWVSAAPFLKRNGIWGWVKACRVRQYHAASLKPQIKSTGQRFLADVLSAFPLPGYLPEGRDWPRACLTEQDFNSQSASKRSRSSSTAPYPITSTAASSSSRCLGTLHNTAYLSPYLHHFALSGITAGYFCRQCVLSGRLDLTGSPLQ